MKKLVLTLLITIIPTLSFASNLKKESPDTKAKMQNYTVKIVNKEGVGGTGAILSSTPKQSFILTNMHVCELLNDGGYVISYKGKHIPQAISKSKYHDLCLVVVMENLNKNLKLAKNVKRGEKIFVSGHPFLMPQMVAEGRMSGSMSVELIANVVDCSKSDWKSNAFICHWFGGMPIVKKYDSKAISATIAPGNSGSAVLNKKGEIVGLVFAGLSRGLSYGLIVPLSYIKTFLRGVKKDKIEWHKIDNKNSLREFYKNSKNKKLSNYLIDSKVDKNLLTPAIYSRKFDKISNILKNKKEVLNE